MKKNIKKYLKRILKLIRLDEMEILPGHLAFYLVLMMVPVCSLIGLLSSALNLHTISDVLKENIPLAVFNLINNVNKGTNNYNIFLFIILSLWLSSRGTKAIIISSNLLFKIKDKNNIKIRLKALLMVIILFLLIDFIILVPVLGDIIIKYLSTFFKETGTLVIKNIYHLLKYPVSILLMFILIKFLYTMAPSEKIESKYMNHGALFTTISWLILSRVYSYHLNNYSSYNVYYGNLSNILILLVWVYLLSYIFTIGLSLNADNYLMSRKETNDNKI